MSVVSTIPITSAATGSPASVLASRNASVNGQAPEDPDVVKYEDGTPVEPYHKRLNTNELVALSMAVILVVALFTGNK